MPNGHVTYEGYNWQRIRTVSMGTPTTCFPQYNHFERVFKIHCFGPCFGPGYFLHAVGWGKGP